MVYGLNRFEKLNPVNEYTYQNNDMIFTESADVESVVEIMSNAIINDQNEVFKICVESTSTEILQEGVRDIARKIKSAIRTLIDKVKKLPGMIMKFFRDLISKFKFKTDKNGQLTKEAVVSVEKRVQSKQQSEEPETEPAKSTPAPDTTYSRAATQNQPLALGTHKKWRDIYELVGVKLRDEVEVLNMFEDAKQFSDSGQWKNPMDSLARSVTMDIDKTGKFVENFFSTFSRAFHDKTFQVIDDNGNKRGRTPDNTIDKAWFQEELAKKREVTSKAVSGKWTTNDGKEKDTIPAHPGKKEVDRVDKEQLDQILQNSEVDISEVEKQMKSIYNSALKQLKNYEDKNIEERNFDYYDDPKEKKKAEDINQLYNQYALKILMEASQTVYTMFNNSCSYIEDTVATACKARKQLEAELLWLYGQEVMTSA